MQMKKNPVPLDPCKRMCVTSLCNWSRGDRGELGFRSALRPQLGSARGRERLEDDPGQRDRVRSGPPRLDRAGQPEREEKRCLRTHVFSHTYMRRLESNTVQIE